MPNKKKGECRHEQLKLPDFDPVAAEKLHSWHDVRMHFPRYQTTCPDCEEFLTIYASEEHKRAGNW